MEVRIAARELPYARRILLVLRDESTRPGVFRAWMRRAGSLLAFLASDALDWREERVRTPLGVEAVELALAREPLLVGVLGASLHMLEGVEEVYPDAPIGLVAARRAEKGETVSVDVYYDRLPPRHEGPAMIVDPMLATGYTMAAVAGLLRRRGANPVIVLTAIASKPGLSYLQASGLVDYVYTLTVDEHLNQHYFIVPGLGDAGDRSLGVTPH